MKRFQVWLFISCLVFLGGAQAQAAEGLWGENGQVFCNATGSQGNVVSTADGSGGTIIVWGDYRNGNNDVYAQRLNSAGVAQWTANGVAICTATGDQVLPQVLADGSGGAFIVWQDSRNGSYYEFYAQKISSAGAVEWTTNGVLVSSNTANVYSQTNPAPVTDGSGGMIMVWQDYRSSNYHIYAQRLNSAGVAQWTANGAVVCDAATSQVNAKMIPDGSGGAIVTWANYTSDYDIYAQRINSSGAIQWGASGVAVSTATSAQYMPEIISDLSSGAIIVWEDYRNGNMDIYAQRISSSGAVQWTANGVAVAVAANEQENMTIASDNASGVIVGWDDFRSGANYYVYAQRLNSLGAAQWTANGVRVCTESTDQYGTKILADEHGGALLAWEDYRASSTDPDQYMQHINSSGTLLWPAGGVAVCTATGSQNEQRLSPDAAGGAVIVWSDYRTGSGDLYAQRMVRMRPQLGTISPVTVAQGETLHATLTGSYFTDEFGAVTGARLTRSGESDIAATNLVVTNAQNATCDFSAASAAMGEWQVVLSDGFGQDSLESVTITVSAALVTATATPTMTATPTVTATPSPTPSATRTPTCTPSATATPTVTGTVTNTPTVTPTKTSTVTPTVTPTFTATLTASRTVTISPTLTETPVCSATTTPTVTRTVTATPTITASGTITATATVTPVSTDTPQSTDTPALSGAWRAYPNPAKDSVNFLVGNGQAGRAEITIYNFAGERVAEVSADIPAGAMRSLVWNCRDCGAGLYLACVEFNGEKKTIKVAVTR